MEAKFPDVPIADIIPRNPALAAKLTEADSTANGGNGDATVQWDEAASRLDRSDLRSYVELAMNLVPNPLLRAADLYREKSNEAVRGLKAGASYAAKSRRGQYVKPLKSAYVQPYERARALAADIRDLAPSGHPAYGAAQEIVDYIEQRPLFKSKNARSQWEQVGRDFTAVATQLEQLKYFLPR